MWHMVKVKRWKRDHWKYKSLRLEVEPTEIVPFGVCGQWQCQCHMAVNTIACQWTNWTRNLLGDTSTGLELSQTPSRGVYEDQRSHADFYTHSHIVMPRPLTTDACANIKGPEATRDEDMLTNSVSLVFSSILHWFEGAHRGFDQSQKTKELCNLHIQE